MNEFDFLPDGKRAERLQAAQRLKLASSLRHVAEVSAPHVTLPLGLIEAQCDAIDAAGRVRPDVYMIYFQCLDAARADDLDGVATAFALLTEATIAVEPPVLRNFGDASFTPLELGRFQRAFSPEDGTVLVMRTADPGPYAQASEAFTRTRTMLASAFPALAAEIDALVTEAVFAMGDAGVGMTFDGCTSFYAPGALLLNAVEHRTVPSALAGLVHESAHGLVFAMSGGASLVENGLDELFDSPLRADPRPMDGIAHATFVSARMALALERALDSGLLDPSDTAEAAGLRDGARQAFRRGLETVRRHGRPTPLGEGLLRSAQEHLHAL